MIIDAHLHQWCLARNDYGWITSDLSELYRDFTLKDWQLAHGGHVAAGILVQCAPTAAETEYLLGIAHSNANVLGVVGWTPLDQDNAAEELERLARIPKLVGIRPMVQDISDDNWLLRPRVLHNLSLAADLGLRFDALVLPRHLMALLQLCRQLPNLKVVIDHAAKPAIKEQIIEPWLTDLAELAQLPQVYCKFSGLLTEAASDIDASPFDLQLKPYTDKLIELFGFRRLLWGSDWPVLNMASGYAQWLDLSRQLLGRLSIEQQSMIFGGNALQFYGVSLASLTTQINPAQSEPAQ